MHSCKPLLVETVISRLWHWFRLALGKATDCKKTSFRILVGIYCHNIPTHTPQSGYHGVTEVAKTTNIAKMAEKCMNSPHSTPYKPHEVGTRKHFFGSKSKKTKRFMIFDPKKRGGCHFLTPPTPPTPRLPQNLKKVGFKWGGGVWGGPDQKLIGGYTPAWL